MNLLPLKRKQWFDVFQKRVSSATMILENEIGEVLIVKANYKEHWTFPGGMIDKGETPLQAAVREVSEEVGIIVNPASVEFVAIVDRKSSFLETYQFIFKASLSSAMLDRIRLQSSEIDEFALVDKARVRSGDLNYGKVIEHWARGTTGYIEQTFGK